MIDNVRMFVSDKTEFENNILKNRSIDLSTSVNVLSGLLDDYPKKGKLYNLSIRISKVRATIIGSLHKLWNIKNLAEDQNHNDFTYSRLKNIINFIIDFFKVNDDNYISGIEFGLNLQIDVDPQHYLNNNILMFNLKSHNVYRNYSGKGDYKEFKKTDYTWKIYNKSKQYKLDSNILRVELKITTKRLLRKLGVISLENLTNREVLFQVFDFFLKEFDQLLIIDEFDERTISNVELERLNRYTNPNFWIRKNKEKSRKVVRRLEKDFLYLIRKNKLDSIKIGLKEKLSLKFNQLINL